MRIAAHVAARRVTPQAKLVCLAATIALAVGGCANLRRQHAAPDAVVHCRQLSREAVSAREHGDPERAQQLLNRAVRMSPSDVEARRELAEVLWQQRRLAEAAAELAAAEQLDPTHVPTVVRHGELLLELGDVAGALARGDRAVAVDSTLAGPWSLRGRALRQQGELDRALADLQQSLRYNPHDPLVLIETAELQFQLGRPERCLSTVQNLLDSYPAGEEPRRALWLQGLAYDATQHPAEAARSLLAASERGAPTPELLVALARVQQQAGQLAAAANSARQALAAGGDPAACQALLARVEGSPGGDAPLRR